MLIKTIQKYQYQVLMACLITVVMAMALIFKMPISMYPNVGYSKIQINGSMPGASAKTIEQSVVIPIESRLLSLDGVRDIESSSNSKGMASVVVTLDNDVDPTQVLMDVQSAVKNAEAILPEEFVRNGISIEKQDNILLVNVNIFSENDEFDAVFSSNFASRNVVDHLSRIKGVGKVVIFGEKQYALRVWLDPLKMRRFNIDVSDVINVLEKYSKNYTLGSVGGAPYDAGNSGVYEYLINLDKPILPENFAELTMEVRNHKEVLKLKDIAKVEVGTSNYSEISTINGNDNVMIGVFQRIDGNALDIVDQVKIVMQDLSRKFPAGLKYEITFDNSRYVSQAIGSVVSALFEAIVIVIFVVYLFLRKVKLTIVTSIVIPLSLCATVIVMYAIGIGFNIVSLLGLIVAAGIVVDDAIILVERVYSKGSGVNDIMAALKIAIGELYRPILLTSSVVLIVFIPLLLVEGVAGILYKEFAITVAIAVIISTIFSLTITPLLCLKIKPVVTGESLITNGEKGVLINSYIKILMLNLSNARLPILLALALSMLFAILITIMPKDFIPAEDQGSITIVASLPPATGLYETEKIMQQIVAIAGADPAIKNTITISGYNFIGGNASHNGLAFSTLVPKEERSQADYDVDKVIARLSDAIRKQVTADVMLFKPPPINGVSEVDGLQVRLVNFVGSEEEKFSAISRKFIADSKLSGLFNSIDYSMPLQVPQYNIQIIADKLTAYGVSEGDAYQTLSVLLGSYYVGNISLFGKSQKIIVQADQRYRTEVDQLYNFSVKNKEGELIPLVDFLNVEPVNEKLQINHYNGYPYREINAALKNDVTIVQAIDQLTLLENKLPFGYRLEWSGQAKEAVDSGSLLLMYSIVIFLSYMLLAFAYKNILLPIPIILVLPVVLAGSFLCVQFAGLTNTLYVQMGAVLIIGVTLKSGIILLDGAIQYIQEGASILDAVYQSSIDRFRPLSMTIISATLGVIPLLFGGEGGASARIALAWTIIGGMLILQLVGSFLIPAFLYIGLRMVNRNESRAKEVSYA